MYWLVFAYLLHTIGELCSSPVSLSFVTKLSPVKYASLMMGVYFAATGLGNKLAGVIGEASQGEPTSIELTASANEISPFLEKEDSVLVKDKDFRLNTLIYAENGELVAIEEKTNEPVLGLIAFEKEEGKQEVIKTLEENNVSKDEPFHSIWQFNFDDEAESAGIHYNGNLVLDEIQTDTEFMTFIGITIFTILIAIIVILLIKPLKRLTHGVEEEETEMLEQEGYEISDNEKEH